MEVSSTDESPVIVENQDDDVDVSINDTDKEYIQKLQDTDSDAAPESSNDLINTYLREIRNIARISEDEEIALAYKIEAGDMEASQKLANANLRLVVAIARRYHGFLSNISLMDLVQEGNRGLWLAARKFRPNRGAKFSTLATLTIKQAIRRYLDRKIRIIHIPPAQRKFNAYVKKAIAHLEHHLGRQPMVSEIAHALSASSDDVQDALLNMNVSAVYFDDVQFSKSGVAGDEAPDFISVTADPKSINPEYLIIAKEELTNIYKRLRRLLSILSISASARNAQIFIERFGLDGSFERKTYDDLSIRYKVSKQRIEQIITIAWKNLKRYGVSRGDSDVLDAEIARAMELTQITGLEARL